MTETSRAGVATEVGAPQAGKPPAACKAPSTQRGRDTRKKLLAAAREIFSRVAFADVRITDITARAGVSSGTFYTYFDTKEQIFREIAAEVLDEMSRASRNDPDNVERDPRRDLEYATREYFLCCQRNARVARSVEELASRDRGIGSARREVLLKGVRRIERWINRLQEKGVCDPTLDTWHTALALQAMNVSVAYDQFVHRDAPGDTEALVCAVTRVWRRTLGLEPSGGT